MSLIDQYFHCKDKDSFSENFGVQLLDYIKNIIENKRKQPDNNENRELFDKDYLDLLSFLKLMPSIEKVKYSSMNIVQKLHYICLFTHKILKREKYYTNIPDDSFEKEFYFLQEYILSDIILYKYHVLTSHNEIYNYGDTVNLYLQMEGFPRQRDFARNLYLQYTTFAKLYQDKLSEDVLKQVIKNSRTSLNYLIVFYKEFEKILPERRNEITFKIFTERMNEFFSQENYNFLDFLYGIQMRLGNISFPDVLEKKIILSSLNDNLGAFLEKIPNVQEKNPNVQEKIPYVQKKLYEILEKNLIYTGPVGSLGPVGPISSSSVDFFDYSEVRNHFNSRDEEEMKYFNIIKTFKIYTYPLFIDIYRYFKDTENKDTENCGTLYNIFINKDKSLANNLSIIYLFLERGKNYTDNNFQMNATEKNFFADNFHLYTTVFVPHAKRIFSNEGILDNDELKEERIVLSGERLVEREKKKKNKKKKKTGPSSSSSSVTLGQEKQTGSSSVTLGQEKQTGSSSISVGKEKQTDLPPTVVHEENSIYHKSGLSSSKPTIDMTGFYQMDIDKLQNLKNKHVGKETFEKIQNRIHNIRQIRRGLGAQINKLKLEELSQNEKKWFFEDNLSREQLQALNISKFFPKSVKKIIYKRINIISDLSNLINLPISKLQQLKNNNHLSEQQKQKVEERIIIKNAIQTLSLPEEYMDRNFETATKRQTQILNGLKEKFFLEKSFHNIRSFPNDMRSMRWHFNQNNQRIFYDITIFILQTIGHINHRHCDNKIKLVLKGSRALQYYFENISTLDTDVILISENNEEIVDEIMDEILSDLQGKFSQTGTFEKRLNQSENTKKILWKPKGYDDDKNNVDIFDCFFKYEQLPDYYKTYTTIGDNRKMLFYIEFLENIKKEYRYLVEKYGGDSKDKFEKYEKNRDKNLYSSFTPDERFNAFNYFKFKNRLEMIEKKETQMNQKK